MKNLVDLHNHSYYSDGTMSVNELIDEAIKSNVSYFAITDHDQLLGSKELLAKQNKYPMIKFISGVEISCNEGPDNFHILGYNVNLNDEHFNLFINQNLLKLHQVNHELIKRMEQKDNRISYNEYEKFEYPRNKGGWKALHYLLYKKVTNKLFDGFNLYKNYGVDYSIVDFPSIKEACDIIHSVNGFAILAHPGKVLEIKDLKLFEESLEKIVSYGIDGIEVYYPTHTPEIVSICERICHKYNLLITTGSDCHGSFQSTSIGQTNKNINELNCKVLFK